MIAALLTGLLAFGAADPVLPIEASCADASADTIAISRETPRGWVIETRTGDGPWEPAFGPVEHHYGVCPKLAAARDGTAVLTIDDEHGSQVIIRRPGGTFGPLRTISKNEGDVQLAAAPGGRVAVLWQDWHTNQGDLNVLVSTPTGPGTPTRLARLHSFEDIDVAFAPDGTVTAAWTATKAREIHKRYAEFRHGHWSAPVDLSFARHESLGEVGIRVAQAPSGRRLMAWEGWRDVRVALDGEPATVLARPGYLDSVHAALADDGSAVVVFRASDGLFAVSRAPGGAWSAPHALPLAGGDRLPEYKLSDGIGVEVAPGGRAVIAWPLKDGRNVSVAGRAGGQWGPATVRSTRLSSWPDSDVFWPRLAGGRIVWIELHGQWRLGEPTNGSLRVVG